MIVRRCFASTAVFVVLTLLGGFDGSTAERWSRQISNSEWIPLANPRTAQLSQSNAGSSLLPASDTHLSNPIQSLALPPALQQQYQEQLIQLQKTQESIQKLLLLQQQLRAQQQLLQSQTFLPGAEDDKQALPPSSLGNSQTAPESIAPEVLVPPHPSSEALPPLYPAQNFLPRRPGQVHQNLNDNQELSNLPAQGQVVLQHGDDTQEGPHTYVTKHGSQRPDGKGLKERPNPGLSQSPLIENDEEEEVQLVYVPAETLAQTGQLKRGRGRKQYPIRQQYHQRENHRNVEQTSLSPDQETYARQVLQQIQKEHEEKAQFLKEERIKEFTRLNEEQKALERKTRLQQEAFQREQELLRQKEAEKKRKELEKLEEIAKQRELERIREAREKQRQEELERRRLAELRAKEEKRREEEAREREERQKQLEHQRILEGTGLQHNPQALFREQVHRQHLADGTRLKKIRGRQRQRVNQYQEQSNYREVTTTPSPNQPPLSVYMGSSDSRLESVKVTDVLKILKDAKTIAVLDNVGPSSPQVFVGPSNLDPPYGYAKFDLPYLSSIDHNRVERKVDKLPFFVAPLSFDPPPGYAKIPFPAPHIGSVVVNTLSETSPEPNAQLDEQNSSPTSLIEPNSYNNADQSELITTTASYASSTAQNFSPESSSAKYESPPSGSRFRFRQYYDNKPTSVISSSYYGEQSTTKTTPKQSYYEQESKSNTQPPKFETTDNYRQEISYSNTPSFQDETVNPHNPSTKKQDLAAHQLALINQELAQQIETQKYNAAEQYQANLGESYDANDVRAPVGPTQFNFPAELPSISPHLPGLINSLLDKQEENLPVTSTPSPTTTTPLTTTTTRVSSTTYRPRGRGRIIPTRPKTTQTPSNKTDRTRRPSYNRSKSRFSTTTEDYRETSYEPTKGKIPETTQKYNAVEHRRPTSRPQKYRNRDRANSQSTQTHQAANYENYPTQGDSQSNASPDVYSPTSESISNLHQKETSPSGVSGYTRENYPSTTPTQTENYPPLREIQHSSALMSDDYKSQNYPQNRPQDARYHQEATYDQNGAFEQPRLEQAPVNGFNYQVTNENSQDQTNIPQRHKEYSRYQENANYNHAITEDPRVRPGEEHRYSPIYQINVAQTQSDYNIGGQNSFRNIDDGKIEDGPIEADPNASPIFIPLQQSKQEDYELQVPSTEASIIEIATTSTTTPAPVIIRQRVRGRLSGRTHQDSAIQTRPRGSQDEYVRFSVVNHDSSRGTSHRNRDGSRTKTRVRPQNHGSQVHTNGNEYIKIHAIQQQKLIATTTPSTTTTTTTTTTTARAEEEDVDYGFIRAPNFRPVQSVHPMDNRFQAPVTYRPALSEIISNDEAAVESSPAHILKNRPKYNQISTRQPTTKIFTTTTETVPVATVMPDNTVYTVKPKTKPDEPKQTRIRGRIRRPGKKRPMTNTESGLEANNELPLDENYSRITPQQLPVTRQQPLYDDNLDVPQFIPNQNRPTQFYEENSEHDPSQEFILNFGNLPEQMSQREEYDQTQLASIPSSKYSHSDRVNEHFSGDIYGAESQWSTKLSKTSFQPSFASNRMTDESKRERSRIRDDQKNENALEIITVGPEVPSGVTVVVSSDYQKSPNNAAGTDAIIDSAVFGMKTNAQDHTEKLNATTAVTTMVLQDRIESDKETSFEAQAWIRDKEDSSVEQATDDTKMKKIVDPLTDRKTRRRRVRVRVRPVIKDDFVTAESQHFNSAMNSLVQDHYKYNSARESMFTTIQPTTVIATTTIATETTRKSLLQDFLEEMLKNDEVSIPTRVTSVSTEIPDWTILTPTTTPYVTSDNGEVTTLKEDYTQTSATLTSSTDEERVTMANKSLTGWRNDIKETTSSEQTVHLSQEETKMQKEENSKEYWDENSQENKSEQNNLENVEIFSQKYNLPSNYPDGSGTSKEIEDTISELTNPPTAKEEIQKLNAIDKGKEHIMTLKRHEKNDEENHAHPKNHRIKWSEVKYPLTLDKSQSTLKLQLTTPIPGVVTRNEGDSSVKTLSDYVKAIFNSMKNAENQEEVEEIAKAVEAKNETLGKADQIIGTTDSSRDIFTTQHINIEEKATNFEETQGITETTTKENTIFETTTLILDTIANTAISSEETIITEPSTTTSPTKTTAPIRRDTGTMIRANSAQTMLGKVLRTSTTTKVSHMTEICYRGRCVMTRPKMDDTMER